MHPASYAIALGSNRRHRRHGSPRAVLRAALAELGGEGVRIAAVSPIIETDPLGPAIRRFANAAALIETPLDPPALLALLKAIERRFGRKRGKRWGDRVLDLDILLWSGGRWRSRTLTVPHVQLAKRDFVLRPLVAIAPDWRGPRSGFTIRQLARRLTPGACVHR